MDSNTADLIWALRPTVGDEETRAHALAGVDSTAERIYDRFVASSAAAVVADIFVLDPESVMSWGVQVRAPGSGKTILNPSFVVKNADGKGAVQWGPSGLEAARTAIPSARKSTAASPPPPMVFKSAVPYSVLGLPPVLNGHMYRFEDPENSIRAAQMYFQAARFHNPGPPPHLGLFLCCVRIPRGTSGVCAVRFERTVHKLYVPYIYICTVL